MDKELLLKIADALNNLTHAVACSEQRFTDRPGYLARVGELVDEIVEEAHRA